MASKYVHDAKGLITLLIHYVCTEFVTKATYCWFYISDQPMTIRAGGSLFIIHYYYLSL